MKDDSKPPLETRYVSPDGQLTFLKIVDDGDVILGFDGHPWHTHGDILAELAGLPIDVAVSQYIDALLNSRAVIAIAKADGKILDTWIADLPLKPDPYKPDNETITYRYWNGRAPA